MCDSVCVCVCVCVCSSHFPLTLNGLSDCMTCVITFSRERVSVLGAYSLGQISRERPGKGVFFVIINGQPLTNTRNIVYI